MGSPTPEQKRKTILLARKVMQNMLEDLAPGIREYVENQQYLLQTAPWNPRQPEPAETPEERARMTAFLAEIATQKPEKK